MLSKEYRLSRTEVEKTLKQGSFFRGASCTVRYIPSPSFKVGVSISKKVAKTAVARNAIRRYVYAQCAQYSRVKYHLVFCMVKTDPSSVETDVKSIFSSLTKPQEGV